MVVPRQRKKVQMKILRGTLTSLRQILKVEMALRGTLKVEMMLS